MIARALIHEPKLLILDEPTAGVDVELRLGMWEYLKKLNANGTTILLTTHYLEEAEELCNNVAIIRKGDIVLTGSIKKLLSEHPSAAVYTVETDGTPAALPSATGMEWRRNEDGTLHLELSTATLDDAIRTLQQANLPIAGITRKKTSLEDLFLETIR